MIRGTRGGDGRGREVSTVGFHPLYLLVCVASREGASGCVRCASSRIWSGAWRCVMCAKCVLSVPAIVSVSETWCRWRQCGGCCVACCGVGCVCVLCHLVVWRDLGCEVRSTECLCVVVGGVSLNKSASITPPVHYFCPDSVVFTFYYVDLLCGGSYWIPCCRDVVLLQKRVLVASR